MKYSISSLCLTADIWLRSAQIQQGRTSYFRKLLTEILPFAPKENATIVENEEIIIDKRKIWKN